MGKGDGRGLRRLASGLLDSSAGLPPTVLGTHVAKENIWTMVITRSKKGNFKKTILIPLDIVVGVRRSFER